jgi:phosphatidylinositol-3-phosphatase
VTRKTCSECGAARAPDQRYCLKCGARLGFLPAAIAAQIGRARKFATGRFPAIKAPASGMRGEKGSQSGDGEKKGWPYERSDFMPSPRAVAAAVIGMLALGVALGSATNELAQSAGISAILFEEAPPAEEEAVAEAPAEPAVEEAGGEAAPVEAAPSVIPEEAPLVEEPLPAEPEPAPAPIKEELPTGLPEVKHAFVIMLGENGYEETFGEKSTSEYLSKELPTQGEILSNYYAVTKGQLANQIALLGGQGPTPETQAGCPNYGDVTPGTELPEGQVEGNGCIYPATTKTLLGQLEEQELAWRAYIDAEEPTPGAEPASGCYVNQRNPFAYFHSILDAGKCSEADAGLGRLANDLTLKPDKFPSLAYISPDPAVSEETLKTIVPNIEESFAYKDGGLIVITSTQARQEGEAPDTSSCCIAPDYPNLEEPEGEEPVTGPVRTTGGGGRVGALLISPFVEAGTTSETYFNHYSLLVTLEELFGLERIGYAAEPALAGFDETIFNAAS